MRHTLLLACALAWSAPALAADPPAPPNRFAASIVPAERFEAGALLVERHGKEGRPLVLIPGLASGSWVWQGLVREFSGDHVLYVVTLPGFDGRAPVEGNMLEAARRSLAALIAERKLDKPVLVGHSLGGTLAFALAQDLPAAVGGVVAIDGLPVFPGTEDMAPAERAQAAEEVRAAIAAAPPDAYARQQQQYMRGTGVVDMGKADDLAKLAARSDQAAVGQYTAEALALDLRPGLPKISAPVLLVSPYFAPDASQHGLTAPMKDDYYRSLLAGTPRAEVVSLSPARHFVMFDQPRALADTIRRYLAKL
jgi:pimeloyl-ACP methyl ester carboxylesterase